MKESNNSSDTGKKWQRQREGNQPQQHQVLFLGLTEEWGGERREGLGKSREKKKDRCGLKFGEKEKAGEGKNWGKRGM